MVVIGKFRDKSDLRKKRRQPIRYGARILLDQRGSTKPCLISDISETGARLVTEQDEELPDKFILLLTPASQARRTCKLVWRNGKVIGVSFVNPTN